MPKHHRHATSLPPSKVFTATSMYYSTCWQINRSSTQGYRFCDTFLLQTINATKDNITEIHLSINKTCTMNRSVECPSSAGSAFSPWASRRLKAWTVQPVLSVQTFTMLNLLVASLQTIMGYTLIFACICSKRKHRPVHCGAFNV